jgi:hypothetical protein
VAAREEEDCEEERSQYCSVNTRGGDDQALLGAAKA